MIPDKQGYIGLQTIESSNNPVEEEFEMKNRPIKIVLAIFAITAAMLASGCGSTVEGNPPADSLESADSAQPVEATSTVAEPLGTSRSNPAPAGSEVVIDGMAFVILSSTRPATDIVMSGDQFNTQPEEGQEYVFVELQVTCQKSSDEQCDFSMRGFSFLGSFGITRFIELFVEGVDGLLKVEDLSGGQALLGIIPFIVPTDETDLMLVNETFFGDTFYLAIE